MVCSDTCYRSSDGNCYDGGPGSSYYDCSPGKDCADCGTRYLPLSPPPPSPPPSHPPLPPPPSPPPSSSPPPGCQKGICIDRGEYTSYYGYDISCMYFISGSLINKVCPEIPNTMGKGNGQCLDGRQQLYPHT